MENKNEKALELFASSKICEYIKEERMNRALSIYLSRLMVDLVGCASSDDPNLELRMLLISFFGSKDLNIDPVKGEDGMRCFKVHWKDTLDATTNFHKWINDLGEDYNETN